MKLNLNQRVVLEVDKKIIVFSARGLTIVFQQNCGINMMFLMKKKVFEGPKHRPTLPRNSQANIAQRILIMYGCKPEENQQPSQTNSEGRH